MNSGEMPPLATEVLHAMMPLTAMALHRTSFRTLSRFLLL